MQSLVYETPVETQHDLVARTAVAVGNIQEMLGISQKSSAKHSQAVQNMHEVGDRPF
jgi:hypothetical protein